MSIETTKGTKLYSLSVGGEMAGTMVTQVYASVSVCPRLAFSYSTTVREVVRSISHTLQPKRCVHGACLCVCAHAYAQTQMN